MSNERRTTIDPTLIASLALAAINSALNIIKEIKGSGALTGDQLAALADQQDAANIAQLKKLLGQ